MALHALNKKRARDRDGDSEGTATSTSTSDRVPSALPPTSGLATSPSTDSTAGVTASLPKESSGTHATTNNFRNVSACNRCRFRKNRCDQALPSCSGCSRAKVKCVGFDPVSKRTIPRSYVYYLETRVHHLERLLGDHNIPCPPPQDDFAIDESIKPGINVPFPVQADEGSAVAGRDDENGTAKVKLKTDHGSFDGVVLDPALKAYDHREGLEKLVKDTERVSAQGASVERSSRSSSGISFARVVSAAVKSSVSQVPTERRGTRPSKRPAAEAMGNDAGTSESSSASGKSTSMRESFFGLHTRPSVTPAPFPEKATALELVDLYFEHGNPQIPVLHRGEFMALLTRAYAAEPSQRTARELYFLNIVFAIGSGIILDLTRKEEGVLKPETAVDLDTQRRKRQKFTTKRSQPEEFHSSAVVHLENFLGSSRNAEGMIGGLEELQAVLLLAALALLRPIAPGLWYIVGVATRLAVDLGLHSEEINSHLDDDTAYGSSEETRSLGRMQWIRELRRRLWWCVYSFDRLVSVCVGRPFGITDEVVTTEFPSLLDDRDLTVNGFLRSAADVKLPSYKLVAHQYFRLRLLQSEILQVLQHKQTERARMTGANQDNAFIHSRLLSPFLNDFDSFRDWRADVDRRLWEWKESAPKQSETGVAFQPLFLELNYWQAVILLYRQSLAVPEPLAGELSSSTGDDVRSPEAVTDEAKDDEQMVFMKVAQAGQTVLKIYRQLHHMKLVNYTFLATHHIFMSGISFLYAIWHSTLVRSQLTLDDVDYTVLIATSVLSDLTDKCPPAEACRDAFLRMSKATISMVKSTTGFGDASTLASQPLNSPGGFFSRSHTPQHRTTSSAGVARTEGLIQQGYVLHQQQLQQPITFRRRHAPISPVQSTHATDGPVPEVGFEMGNLSPPHENPPNRGQQKIGYFDFLDTSQGIVLPSVDGSGRPTDDTAPYRPLHITPSHVGNDALGLDYSAIDTTHDNTDNWPPSWTLSWSDSIGDPDSTNLNARASAIIGMGGSSQAATGVGSSIEPLIPNTDDLQEIEDTGDGGGNNGLDNSSYFNHDDDYYGVGSGGLGFFDFGAATSGFAGGFFGDAGFGVGGWEANGADMFGGFFFGESGGGGAGGALGASAEAEVAGITTTPVGQDIDNLTEDPGVKEE